MSAKTAIIVHNFDLSEDTRQQIDAAARTLIESENRVSRVDVTLEGDYRDNTRVIYNVTLRVQHDAELLFELKQGDRLVATVQSAVAAIRQRLHESPQAQTAMPFNLR